MGENDYTNIVSNVIQHLDVGVVVFLSDQEEKTACEPVYINARFKEMTGYSLDDMKRVGFGFIKPVFEHDSQERTMNALHTHKNMKARVRVIASTGNIFSVWVRGKEIAGQHGDPNCYAVILEQNATLIAEDKAAEKADTSEKDVLGKARDNEKFLRDAVAAAGIGLWEWYVPTSEVFYSPEWFTIIGYEPNEYPSGFDTWEMLSHKDDTAEILAKADSAFQGEIDEYEGRFRMRCKDGSWKWIKAEGKVVERDACGDAVRILGTHVDVSKEVAREEALKNALAEAEEAKQSKERFLATMSHEIRTPLNGILGMLDFVIDSDLDDEQRENLEVANVSAKNLLFILNQTLDYSKLNSSAIELENITFDLRRTIEDNAYLFSANARTKGISVKSDIASDFPDAVVGDANKINQVLLNLIGNALKFTQKGGITLKLCAEKRSDAFFDAIIEVEDTGVGIPSSAQDKIFESFQQADSSTSRKFGGSGLGLAITKQICVAMDGSITVRSEEGKGSTFSIKVPMKIGSRKAIREETPVQTIAINQTLSQECLILVVEDHPVNQKIVGKLLDQLSLRYEIADDGQIAVEKTALKRYDLIFMDIQMPRMDGTLATKAIRSDASNPNYHVPIIALTANAIAGDREKYLACGMTDYITKPIEKTLLFQKTAQYLGTSLQEVKEEKKQVAAEALATATSADDALDALLMDL